MTFGNMQSFFELHYDDVMPDGTLFIRKGFVDQIGKYKIVINAGDHEPPHIHVSLNNKQIGSYLINTGEPYRVFHKDINIDSLVKFWFKNNNNKSQAEEVWQRLTGR